MRDERGFSFVEVMVAMGIFSIVAVFMTQTIGTGLKGVLGGKRREMAIQEGQRILELARSLSYDAIGLSQSDPTFASDPAIQTQNFGSPAVAKKAYQAGTTWEPLLYVSSPITDFSPHQATLTRGSSTLTRYVYVTGIDDDADGEFDLKRVTVRVSWDETGAVGPANEIRVQTKITEAGLIPTGTGSSTGRLTGGAFASGGTLSVAASTLLGLSAPLNVALPTTTGESDYRAVSTTDCTAKSLAMSVLDVLDVPGDSVAVSADDDSRTTTSANPPAQSKPGNLTIPGVGNLLGGAVGSPVACEANVNTLGHELGTASALSTALQTQTNILALSGLINWLLTLASVDVEPVTQQIDHLTVSGQREVLSQASAELGAVQALKLPFAGLTNGLVQVNGLSYSATVRGAQGTPSAAPVITAPSFTVQVMDNGNKLGAACTTGLTLTPGITVSRSGSYCVFTVVPSAAGFSGLRIPVSHNFTSLIGLNVVSLAYTINVDILPPTKDGISGTTGTNGEKTWTAEYTPLSVSASLTAGVPLLGLNLIDADVDLNLGTVRAQACAGATCA
jgi:prepilin-type N-terminal cleavage/methylation domain-containing protein